MEITSIDLGKRRVVGLDRQGQQLEFSFHFTTPLRRLVPRDTIVPLLDAAKQSANGLPFQVNDEVLIFWQLDPVTQQRVVYRFTIY